MENTLIVKEASRLDAFLSKETGMSRSQASKIVKGGNAKVNGKTVDKASFSLKPGDSVEFEKAEAEVTGILPPKENVSLNFVYQDDDFCIIDKPRGMVVHPAPGHYDDTLVNYLFNQNLNFEFNDDDGDNIRPGIVHRIDKDTQGLLAIALNEETQSLLQQEIRDREFHRTYLALVYGDVPDRRFRIEAPLTRPNHTCRKAKVDIYNGRDAITHCVKLSTNGKVSLLKCTLETGRTHQIRAHLAYIGYPIVGDPLYGKMKDDIADQGQLLTAYSLSLIHPYKMKRMTFYTPIDDYFKKVLRYFYR